MSITSIGSGSVLANSVAFTAASPAAASSNSSSGPVSGHHHHSRGGSDPFMQEVAQALSQLGINLPTQSASASTSQSDQNATTSDGSSTSGTQAVGEDIHKLMHDLFAALHQAQTQAPGSTGTDSDGDNDRSSISSTKAAGYANLTTGLQGLIQQLGSGTTATNGPLSALQTDFQTLLNDAQSQTNGTSTGSSSTDSQSATLQSFLQTLLNNRNGHSSSSAAVGGVVSTVA